MATVSHCHRRTYRTPGRAGDGPARTGSPGLLRSGVSPRPTWVPREGGGGALVFSSTLPSSWIAKVDTLSI